jgi:hypothetical protein
MNNETAEQNKTGEGIAPRDKRYHFRTAKAVTGCAHFNAGDYVSVAFQGVYDGVGVYLVDNLVPYFPEEYLTDFVL